MHLQNEKDANEGNIDASRAASAIYQERQDERMGDESIEQVHGVGNASFTDSRSGSYVTYYKNQKDLYQLQYDTAQEERMRQYDYENQQMEMTGEEQMSLAPLDYNNIKLFIFHSQEEVKVCITLQALKMRISKSRPGDQRRHVLFAFSEYDILG